MSGKIPGLQVPNIDQLCINTIRTLSMDAVQAANSGHPGTPMAMAPVVYCLWQRFLRFDSADPISDAGFPISKADSIERPENLRDRARVVARKLALGDIIRG